MDKLDDSFGTAEKNREIVERLKKRIEYYITNDWGIHAFSYLDIIEEFEKILNNNL